MKKIYLTIISLVLFFATTISARPNYHGSSDKFIICDTPLENWPDKVGCH